MKQFFIGLFGIFTYFAVMNTVNFINTIVPDGGNRILYYILMVGILFACLFLVVYPLIRIYAAPEIPSLSVSQQQDLKQLYKHACLFAGSCSIDKNGKELYVQIEQYYKNRDKKGLMNLIQKEIDERTQSMDKVIKRYAANTLLITTVSQSGKFDLFTSLALNIRLIKKIVELSGFRPTKPQMLRLYYNVLLASMISFASQGVFDELDDLIDDDSLVEGLAGLAGSVLSGATNALMTLRVGFMTQYYLTHGAGSISTDEAKRLARKEVRTKMIKVLPSLFGEVGQKAKNVVCSVTKGKIKNVLSYVKDIIIGWFRLF